MDIFKLYRNFWDFAFENPEKIKPNHIAIFSFAIEHCNRLGWKQKYGLPSAMVMEATGIKSYNTYISAFNELVDFGFIKLIEKSKNQYSSNIIALSNFDKAHNKALDKALIKHTTKQSESTRQSIDSIDIQDTIIQETKNNYGKNSNIFLSESEYLKLCQDFSKDKADKAIDYLSDWGLEKPKQFKEYKNHNLTLRRWVFEAIEKKQGNKQSEIYSEIDKKVQSSLDMIKRGDRTNKEHNEVVRNNKYDSKYLLPE
jgi:hypothetical protein